VFKSIAMIILFGLAIVLLVQVFRPQGAAAASSPVPAMPPAFGSPGTELPGINAPFDETPITPVESAGAPMHDQQ